MPFPMYYSRPGGTIKAGGNTQGQEAMCLRSRERGDHLPMAKTIFSDDWFMSIPYCDHLKINKATLDIHLSISCLAVQKSSYTLLYARLYYGIDCYYDYYGSGVWMTVLRTAGAATAKLFPVHFISQLIYLIWMIWMRACMFLSSEVGCWRPFNSSGLCLRWFRARYLF